MSPPTIASSILPHCCSNMDVLTSQYTYITPLSSVTCGTSLQPVVALPSFTGTSGDSSGRFTRCRLLGGSPLPSSPSSASGSSGSTWVLRWWYLAPENGIATYGDMGTSPGFFLCFGSPKKRRKKNEHKIYIVKIRSDQQKIWDLYTNLPYQLKISCRVDPNRIDMSRFLYFKILASSEPPEPLQKESIIFVFSTMSPRCFAFDQPNLAPLYIHP